MRRFPISWDGTLASLGLKRKLSASKKDQYWRRRFARIEQLERREMLAADYVVTTLEDIVAADDVLSLREAISAAASDGQSDQDTITFDPSLYAAGPATITLGSLGSIITSTDFILDGPGADLLTISANASAADQRRVFQFNTGADVTLTGVTIADGYVISDGGGIWNRGNLTLREVTFRNNVAVRNSSGGAGQGGGLFHRTGKLIIRDSTFEENTARYGGGARLLMGDSGTPEAEIYGVTFVSNHALDLSSSPSSYTAGGALHVQHAVGDVLVANSTFSDNTTTYGGGAIRAAYGVELTVVNSTIAFNHSDNQGGGFSVSGATVVIDNSIVAANTSGNGYSDAVSWSSPTWKGSHNLFGSVGNAGLDTTPGSGNTSIGVGVNPGLAPLGDYGGPTATHAILAGSPAIDAGILYSDAVLTGAPVAYYRFDEPSGSTANDSAGTNNAVVYGAPSIGAGAVGGGKSLELDGVDDYAQITNATIGASFTAEAWVSSSEVKWNKSAWIASARGANGFIIHPMAGSTKWKGYIYDSSGTAYEIGIHTPPGGDIQSWNHYAITFDASTGQAVMYFDGNAVAIKDLSSITRTEVTDATVLIGKDDWSTNGIFGAGKVDEVALYDTALSAAAIRSRASLRAASFADQRAGSGYSARAVNGMGDIGPFEYGAQPVASEEPFEVTRQDGYVADGENWVASNAAGASVVVWEGSGAEGDGIYIQHINPNLSVSSLPRLVDIGMDATDVSSPRVAIDGQGRHVVVWRVDSGDNAGIWMRRFDAAGGAIDEFPEQVNDGVDTFYTPTVETNEAGQVVILWKSGADTLRFRRFTTSGLSLDNSSRVAVASSADLYVATSGRSAVVTEDGGFYVLWEDDNETILIKQFEASGAPASDAVVVGSKVDDAAPLPDPESGAQSEVTSLAPYDIAPDGNGGVLVAWAKQLHVTDNESQGGNTTNASTTDALLYVSPVSASGVIGGRITIDASTIETTQVDYTSPFTANYYLSEAYTINRPTLAVDAEGRFGLAWSRSDSVLFYGSNFDLNSSGNIVYSPGNHHTNSGSSGHEMTWFNSAGIRLLDVTAKPLPGVSSTYSSLTSDAAGNFLLTARGNDSEIWGQRFRLPQRVTLSDGGLLTIDETIAQNQTIVLSAAMSDGQWWVTLNSKKTNILASAVTAISIVGGANDTRVDLSGVVAGQNQPFANLNTTDAEMIVVDGGSGNDVIIGSAYPQTLRGGAGDDRILGGDANDLLYGGEGDDVLLAGLGADELYGGVGNDTLRGGEGNDTLYGLDETTTPTLQEGEEDNDLLFGEEGDDDLYGSAGDDRLDGGSGGDDLLVGGDGDDVFVVTDASADTVTISDTGGVDTIDLSAAASGATVSLEGGSGVFAIASVGFTVSGVENIIGTPYADVLIGNSFANRIEGGGGDDHLFSGGVASTEVGGVDTLAGGQGNDHLFVQVVADAQGEDPEVSDQHLLQGGAGSDFYYVSNVDATVTISDPTGDDTLDLETLGWAGAAAPVIDDSLTEGLQQFGDLKLESAGLADLENRAVPTDAEADLTVTYSALNDGGWDISGASPTLTASATIDGSAAGVVIQYESESLGSGAFTIGGSGASITITLSSPGALAPGMHAITIWATKPGDEFVLYTPETVVFEIAGAPTPVASVVVEDGSGVPVTGSVTVQAGSSTEGTASLFLKHAETQDVTYHYSLGPGAPRGASIDANGAFSWTPSSDQLGSHTFDLRVTEPGYPPVRVSKSVTIEVESELAIDSFELISDTGASGTDGISANTWLQGKVVSNTPLENVRVVFQLGYPGTGNIAIGNDNENIVQLSVSPDNPREATFLIIPDRSLLTAGQYNTIGVQLNEATSPNNAIGPVHTATFNLDPSENIVPSIVSGSFGLATDTGIDLNGITSDPTLVGKVSHPDGGIAGLKVDIYRKSADSPSTTYVPHDPEVPGSAQIVATVETDDEGSFTYTPANLSDSDKSLWWAVVREELFEDSPAESTPDPSSQLDSAVYVEFRQNTAPTVTSVYLINDTGTPADNKTSDTRVGGQVEAGETDGVVEGIVVEVSYTGTETVTEFAVTDSDGKFELPLSHLQVGTLTPISVRAIERDTYTGQVLTGTPNNTLSITHDPADLSAPTIEFFGLGGGVANNYVGEVAGYDPNSTPIVIEFSTASDTTSTSNEDEFEANIVGYATPAGEERSFAFTVRGLGLAPDVQTLYARAVAIGDTGATAVGPEVSAAIAEVEDPTFQSHLAYVDGDDRTALPIVEGVVDYAGDMADLLLEYRIDELSGKVYTAELNEDGTFRFVVEGIESAAPGYDPNAPTHSVQLRVRPLDEVAAAPEFSDDGVQTDTDGFVSGLDGGLTDSSATWLVETLGADGAGLSGDWHNGAFARDWEQAEAAWEAPTAFTYDANLWASSVDLTLDTRADTSLPLVSGTLSGLDSTNSNTGLGGLTVEFYLRDGQAVEVLDGSAVTDTDGSFVYHLAGHSVGVNELVVRLVQQEASSTGGPTTSMVVYDGNFAVTADQTLALDDLSLKSPTLDDGQTLQAVLPTLIGALGAAIQDRGLRTVEFDYGAGTFEASTLTDASGAFEFTPESLAGHVSSNHVTVAARMAETRTDEATGQSYKVYGAPLSLTWEVVGNQAPSITQFELANDTGYYNAGHQVLDRVTSDPTLVGRVVDEDGTHQAFVNVEFDHNGNGQVDGWTTTDANGNFRYTPKGIDYGHWDIRARVVERDGVTGDDRAAEYGGGGEDWACVTATGDPNISSGASGFTFVAPLGVLVDNLGIVQGGATVDPRLSGTVKDSQGGAAPFATVDFFRYDAIAETIHEALGSVVSDENGDFEFMPVGLPFSADAANLGVIAVPQQSPYFEEAPPASSGDTYTYASTFASTSTAGTPTVAAALANLSTLLVSGEFDVEDDATSPQYVELQLLDSNSQVLSTEIVSLETQFKEVLDNEVVTVKTVYAFSYPLDLTASGASEVAEVSARVVAWKEDAFGVDPMVGGFTFGGWSSLDIDTSQGAGALAFSDDVESTGTGVVAPELSGAVDRIGATGGTLVDAQYEVELDFDGDGLADETVRLDDADPLGSGSIGWSHVLEGFEAGEIELWARPVAYVTYRTSEGEEVNERVEASWGEDPISIDFESPAPSINAPGVHSPEPSNSGATKDPTITGEVTSPLNGVSTVGMTVEIDENLDGIADGTAVVLPSETFEYTLRDAKFGEVTVNVRAVDTYSHTSELAGQWQPVVFTYLPPTPPEVLSVGLQTSHTNAELSSEAVTNNPVVVGEVTVPAGAYSVTVQFDHEGDGVIDGTTTTDALGRFTYVPENLRWGEINNFQMRPVARVGDQAIPAIGWHSFSFFHDVFDAPVISQLTVVDASRAIIEGRATSGGFGQSVRVEVVVRYPGGVAATNSPNTVETSGDGYFRMELTELPALAAGQKYTIEATPYLDDPNSVTDVPGETASETFEYTPTSVDISQAALTAFGLAHDTGPSDSLTADPTLAGTVSGAVPQLYVEFSFVSSHTDAGLYRTPVMADGTYSYTPTGLTPGVEYNVWSRLSLWNPGDPQNQVSAGEQYSAWTGAEQFTLDLSQLPAPLVTSIVLSQNQAGENETPQSSTPVFKGQVSSDGAIAGLKVLFDHNDDGVIDGWTTTRQDGTFLYRADSIEPGPEALTQTLTAWVEQQHYQVEHTTRSAPTRFDFILTRAPIVRNLEYTPYDAAGPADATLAGEVFDDSGATPVAVEYYLFDDGIGDAPPTDLDDWTPPASGANSTPVANDAFTVTLGDPPSGPLTVVLRATNDEGVDGPWRIFSVVVGEDASPILPITNLGLAANIGSEAAPQTYEPTLVGQVGSGRQGAFDVVRIEVWKAENDPNTDPADVTVRTNADGEGRFEIAIPDLDPGDHVAHVVSLWYDPALQEEVASAAAEFEFEIVSTSPSLTGLWLADGTPVDGATSDASFRAQLQVGAANAAGYRVAYEVVPTGQNATGEPDGYAISTPGASHNIEFTPVGLPATDVTVHAWVVEWSDSDERYLRPGDSGISAQQFSFTYQPPSASGPQLDSEVNDSAAQRADGAFVDAVKHSLSDGLKNAFSSSSGSNAFDTLALDENDGGGAYLAGSGMINLDFARVEIMHRGAADEVGADGLAPSLFEFTDTFAYTGDKSWSGEVTMPVTLTGADGNYDIDYAYAQYVLEDNGTSLDLWAIYAIQLSLDWESTDGEGLNHNLEIAGSYVITIGAELSYPSGGQADVLSYNITEDAQYEFWQRESDAPTDEFATETVVTAGNYGLYYREGDAFDDDSDITPTLTDRRYNITEDRTTETWVTSADSDSLSTSTGTESYDYELSAYAKQTSEVTNSGSIVTTFNGAGASLTQDISGQRTVTSEAMYESTLDGDASFQRALDNDDLDRAEVATLDYSFYQANLYAETDYQLTHAERHVDTAYQLEETSIERSTQSGLGVLQSGEAASDYSNSDWDFHQTTEATTRTTESGTAGSHAGPGGATVESLDAALALTTTATANGHGGVHRYYDEGADASGDLVSMTDSGEVRSSYQFDSNAVGKLDAVAYAVDEYFTLSGAQTLNVTSTSSDLTDVTGLRVEVTQEAGATAATTATIDYSSRTSSQATVSTRAETAFRRDPSGGVSSGAFSTSATGSAISASQAGGMSVVQEPSYPPSLETAFQDKQSSSYSLAADVQASFGEDGVVNGSVKRSENVDARSSSYVQLGGELVAPSLQLKVADATIDSTGPATSFSLEKAQATSQSQEAYIFQRSAGVESQQGTFSDESTLSVEGTSQVRVLPGSGADFIYAQREDTGVQSTSSLAGSFTDNGLGHRRVHASSDETLESHARSRSLFGDSYSEGSTSEDTIHYGVISGDRTSSESTFKTQGIVSIEETNGVEAVESASTGTFGVSSLVSSHVITTSSSSPNASDYFRVRQNVSQNATSTAYGEITATAVDDSETSRTTVDARQGATARESYDSVSRTADAQEESKSLVQSSGRSRARQSGSSEGTVTASPRGTSSLFFVDNDATAKSQDKVEWNERSGSGPTLESSQGTRIDKSSFDSESDGYVKTDIDGDRHAEFDWKESSTASVDLTSKSKRGYTDSFDKTRYADSSARINQSLSAEAQGQLREQREKVDVEVTSSSQSQTGGYHFEGGSFWVYYHLDGAAEVYHLSASFWTVDGDADGSTETEEEWVEGFSDSSNSEIDYEREDNWSKKTKLKDDGGWSYETTQDWDSWHEEYVYSTEQTITTTDVGKLTEDFTSAGGESGDRQTLERTHHMNWRKVTSEPVAPYGNYIMWANFGIPPADAGLEEYLTKEYTDSLIETRFQAGDSHSSHTLGPDGGARNGTLVAHSQDIKTRIERDEHKWNYSPPVLDPGDDGIFESLTDVGRKTKDKVYQSGVRVNETAGYSDDESGVRQAFDGYARTVNYATTGEVWSEAGKKDYLFYHIANGSVQNSDSEDEINRWESIDFDLTTVTLTTDTYYGKQSDGQDGGAARATTAASGSEESNAVPGAREETTSTVSENESQSGRQVETSGSRLEDTGFWIASTVVDRERTPQTVATETEGETVVKPSDAASGGQWSTIKDATQLTLEELLELNHMLPKYPGETWTDYLANYGFDSPHVALLDALADGKVTGPEAASLDFTDEQLRDILGDMYLEDKGYEVNRNRARLAVMVRNNPALEIYARIAIPTADLIATGMSVPTMVRPPATGLSGALTRSKPNFPQPVRAQAPRTLFKNGELFEAAFDTSKGKVGLLAETVVDGKTLRLKDVVIEPLKTGKLNIGPKEVLAARQQLIEQARAAGFEKLIISGKRLTGANKGKLVDLTIDLTK
ncbi:Bifunctional hemolysin/adenylate cyclase precursor [Posidoniimonas corsicana]|uniref:Bifunctional hemolysin/adenylate cyclase n=1 Tax=Posidoniimonas corsicana TaxID=1938618 RepID=A0A5C5VD38_9BACT|nr:choice-of-anchor Q domain-containing protein [Posidoniimonas corsicana]TWT35622.1 Bifunctional hemolysin/adenylate cyclase precursor [Posidoniimonas corsicana]